MAAVIDPCLERPEPKLFGRAASVSNIFPQLLLELESDDKQRRLLAAQDLVAYEEHLQISHIERLIPNFKDFLFADLDDEDDAALCAAAAQFFTPFAEAETGSVSHPSDSVNEAILESKPAIGWVPTLLDWGAVPRLISLLAWPNQADTRPWPGAYAAAGGRLLCALAAHQNVRAHKELLQQSEAVPALLHALEEVWLNTCSAEILFYLADSPVPGGLDRLRMSDGAAILVSYITRNIQNRRKRMRSYGPTAAENPPFHEVAALYYAVQLLILLAVRPDGGGDDSEDDALKLGLPVPTQDIVELVQTVLGLMPPAKLAAAVQKLMNCCPEARAALEEQVLSQDSRGTGWFSNAWAFMKKAMEDPRETPLAKSEKAV